MDSRREYKNTAIIAIGSNIGDKLENSRQGIAALESSGKLEIVCQSSFYLTEPVGYTDQPWFINSVLMAHTNLAPLQLMQFLKKMERQCGRVDSDIRNGPRVLDFDIIFYNDWVIESNELIIPHPRMHERGFVLKPLDEIAPDWIHPVFQKTVNRLLHEIGDQHEECIPMEALYN